VASVDDVQPPVAIAREHARGPLRARELGAIAPRLGPVAGALHAAGADALDEAQHRLDVDVQQHEAPARGGGREGLLAEGGELLGVLVAPLGELDVLAHDLTRTILAEHADREIPRTSAAAAGTARPHSGRLVHV